MEYNQNAPRVGVTTRAPRKVARQQAAEQQLHEIIDGMHDVLLSATTIFPFTLFPDTINIDRQKLTVTHRVFFAVAEVMSIQIEDVLNVTADVGPFFGSVKILTRFFDPDRPYSVNYLWRNDALKVKRIIQGYITARQQEIDCSVLPTKELAGMLEQIGGGE